MDIHVVLRSPDPRIAASFVYIEANPSRTIRLAELARLSGLSVPRFSHLFALAAGIPPGKYLRELRLRRNPPATKSRLAAPYRSSPVRPNRRQFRVD